MNRNGKERDAITVARLETHPNASLCRSQAAKTLDGWKVSELAN